MCGEPRTIAIIEMSRSLAKMMKKLVEFGDVEETHQRADVMLCEILTDLGYNEVVDAFEQLEKGYR